MGSSLQTEEHRASLAKELCERNGYCGSISYESGIPVWICVKGDHKDSGHVYKTRITSVIPF